MFNRTLTGQGQQSVNLYKSSGWSNMACLGVFLDAGCTRCIAAQRKQNVKEGGKTSVPLAPTFHRRRERVVTIETWLHWGFFMTERECYWDMVIEHCFSNCWIGGERAKAWFKGSLLSDFQQGVSQDTVTRVHKTEATRDNEFKLFLT